MTASPEKRELYWHRLFALARRAMKGEHVSAEFGGNAPEDVQGLLDEAFALHCSLANAEERLENWTGEVQDALGVDEQRNGEDVFACARRIRAERDAHRWSRRERDRLLQDRLLVYLSNMKDSTPDGPIPGDRLREIFDLMHTDLQRIIHE